MKKLIQLFILTSGIMWSQEETHEKTFESFINYTLSTRANHFTGSNYMAKGHKNPDMGFSGKLNFFKIYNVGFGMGVNFSTLKVDDNNTSIGGNINKSNLTSYDFNFLYPITLGEKPILEPTVFVGGFSIRQKSGSKDYGKHSGIFYGFGVNFLYPLNDFLKIYSNLGYHFYAHKIKTTPEFESYFKNSNAVSLSLGLRFF